MNSKLPKFKITIDDEYNLDDEDLGISAIALTSNPAILTKGFAFNAQAPKVKMSFADNLKYRIAAPMMIPMDIYRNDGPDLEDAEYYVQFTAEEIEKIHSKFMRTLKAQTDVFNLEHDESKTVPAFVLEAFLVDSQNKIEMVKAEYGVDVPLGTSFIVTQITDKDYYNELVKNDQIGYSIEGFLGMKLSEIINKNKQKLNKMKNKFNLEAGEYPLADGNILVIAENGTSSIKVVEEVALEEVIEEEVALEEVIEEEVALEEVEEEEVALEEIIEEEVALAEMYSREEIDAKFEELYQMLANKDVELEEEDKDEFEDEDKKEFKLSVHQRFAQFVAFNK